MYLSLVVLPRRSLSLHAVNYTCGDVLRHLLHIYFYTISKKRHVNRNWPPKSAMSFKVQQHAQQHSHFLITPSRGNTPVPTPHDTEKTVLFPYGTRGHPYFVQDTTLKIKTPPPPFNIAKIGKTNVALNDPEIGKQETPYPK